MSTVSFNDIITITDQSELAKLLAKLKLPQAARETVEELSSADVNNQKSIEEFSVIL